MPPLALVPLAATQMRAFVDDIGRPSPRPFSSTMQATTAMEVAQAVAAEREWGGTVHEAIDRIFRKEVEWNEGGEGERQMR
jgi:hypothetical protein